MRVRVLGCSGGIGENLRTTSLLIDDDILIDCGTGVGDLTLGEMRKIHDIFLTHAHLDHIACLPLLADTLFDQTSNHLLTLHCQPETYETIKTHIFNWKIWPDFFELPDKFNPLIRFAPQQPGQILEINNRQIEMIEVNHAVAGVAYRIANESTAMAYSGDTTTNDRFWQILNGYEGLDLLIVECAYLEKDRKLSETAKHYCPTLLAEDMNKLRHQPKTCITHLKPGAEVTIFEELESVLPDVDLLRLLGGEVFHL
jgi:ribonuclease BN (tRNA processing enzyme)